MYPAFLQKCGAISFIFHFYFYRFGRFGFAGVIPERLMF